MSGIEDMHAQQRYGGNRLGYDAFDLPYTPNSTIEDLVNGSLAHRGPHNDASTEQKALDGVATVVLRELNNRTKEINRLRCVEAELNGQLAYERDVANKVHERHKGEVANWRKEYTAADGRARMYEAIINQTAALLPNECDLDAVPRAMREFLDKITTRALGYGMFDDPQHEKDDPLWTHLAVITNRDADTGNKLEQAFAAADAWVATGTATGSFGTGTATGDVMLTNTGSVDVSLKGDDDA